MIAVCDSSFCWISSAILASSVLPTRSIMRRLRSSNGAHTRTHTACGTSRSRFVAPQPRHTAPLPCSARFTISSAEKIDRLVLSAVRRSTRPALPSSRRMTWLLRTRMRSARWSITSWYTSGTPSASASPLATSLPSEPISRLIATNAISAPLCSVFVRQRDKYTLLLGELGECAALAVARVARAVAALRHAHRAVLELRDLAEGVELRVGEHVRRRLVEGERDEHRTARRALVRPRVQGNAAAPGLDGNDVSRLGTQLSYVQRVQR